MYDYKLAIHMYVGQNVLLKSLCIKLFIKNIILHYSLLV